MTNSLPGSVTQLTQSQGKLLHRGTRLGRDKRQGLFIQGAASEGQSAGGVHTVASGTRADP